MRIEPSTPIGHIASELEAALPYFEEAKIDYVLGGEDTLSEACERSGVPLGEAIRALEGIQARRAVERHWEERPLEEVVDYILRHHHDFTRVQVEKVNALLKEAVRTHGFQYPQLSMLKELFLEMGGEMRGHMSREEEFLFPYLIQRDRAGASTEPLPNPFEEIPFFRQPLRVLQWEHRMTGEEWVQVRLLTDNFRPTPNADATVRTLFEELRALERDLHHHVHLENNVLFRRASEKGWIQ